MIWIHRIIFTALLIYAVLIVIAFVAQRKLIYFPPEYYNAPPAEMTEVKTASDVLGWYSPAAIGRPTVMVFHGNASSIDSNMHIFRGLRAAGYGVWSVGYPGYPGNRRRDETPTQANLVKAAVDQYQHLSNMGVETIVFYGTSLGSGVASQLSAVHPPELLILDAPFNSALDMARRQMHTFPSSVLMKDKWRSDLALENLEVPIIWIHGTADRVIPISQGQKLYDGYVGPKSSHILTGAGHVNTWRSGGQSVVLDALEKL